MALDLSDTIADRDFYAPIDTADPAALFTPADMPARWTSQRSGVWTVWTPPQAELAETGWKVHVSAASPQAAEVLDIVARRCVQHGVMFKHLAGTRYYAFLHGKHSSRAQSGKFVAIYPADTDTARAVMTDLERDLTGYEGPYVLTDRRFGESRCVSYRYGAFRPHRRLTVDGTSRWVMLAPDGAQLPDDRTPAFTLPDGVADPFVRTDMSEPDGDPLINGYRFVQVLRHANGGGAYRAVAPDGHGVFVKEARAHNGYTHHEDSQQRLAGEYATLQRLHRDAPGLAPEPVELFRSWEHDFLVTEFVAGTSLRKWMTHRTPVIKPEATRAELETYFAECADLLERVQQQLDRLHTLGLAFVDLSPDNILVQDDGSVRLIDFEAAQPATDPLRLLFTPNYVPPLILTSPEYRASVSPLTVDDYAMSALAQLLVFPLHPVAERNPNALDHLGAELARRARVPERLWRQVVRNHPADGNPGTIAPARVERDPVGSLRRLAHRTDKALLAMLDGPFRTSPTGLRTNQRCVAHGSAGVLHALRLTGNPIPPGAVERLRDDSLRLRDETPPGLMVGNAGIARVLRDLGEDDAADVLLRHATADPLLADSPNWRTGRAGVALAQLAAHAATGRPEHLEHATHLLELPRPDRLPAGLADGRAGIALAQYYLARATGDDARLDTVEALLRDELDEHGVALGPTALGMRVSATDGRRMPYLFAGSAGFAMVLGRYVSVRPDPAWQDVLDRCLTSLRIRHTVFAGLFQGAAGFAAVLADLGDLLDRPDLTAGAHDAARTLFQHAVPHETGVRWLGDTGHRFSADLWSGSAGISLALHRVLHEVPDPLFTLDAGTRNPSRGTLAGAAAASDGPHQW